MERIATLAQGAIGGADAIGVTLLDDSAQPISAVCTNRISAAAIRRSTTTAPVRASMRTARGVVRVDDTHEVADRWPSFSEQASAEGVRSTLAMPLNVGDETFGVFDLSSPSEPRSSTTKKGTQPSS